MPMKNMVSMKSKLSNETKIEGLKEFNKYGDLFQDLTKREHVDTELDVINIIITYDSKYCIAIVNNKDEHFELQGYSLKTYGNTFKKEWKGDYIKMNVIEQTYAGDVFGVAMQDNGKFTVAFINNEGEELDSLDVSAELNIDDKSKPITGFYEPLITCCFIMNDDVFISVYHRIERKQYHFTYSYKNKSKISEVTVTEIEHCTLRNFPMKSFYSPVTGTALTGKTGSPYRCHTFYRQGHAINVNASNPDECTLEKITDADLGSMFLLFDQALVTRSSSSILFFKIDEETKTWK